jgi:outer membrane receptor protein involved in Fe transport
VRGAELNVEWHPAGPDSLSGSIYENRARRLIVQTRDDDSDSYTFVNQGSVTARGVEVEWQHAWERGQRIRANASYSIASDRETVVPIAAYAPRYLVNLTGITPLAGGVQAGVQWRAVARRGGAGAYALANVSLSSPAQAGGWTWSANIQNLFDRRYADPGADLQDQPTIMQASRTLEMTVGRSF